MIEQLASPAASVVAVQVSDVIVSSIVLPAIGASPFVRTSRPESVAGSSKSEVVAPS
ncbi:MAG TPA: hypothetical protein VIG35_00155 [Gaiellaceae bacterium]